MRRLGRGEAKLAARLPRRGFGQVASQPREHAPVAHLARPFGQGLAQSDAQRLRLRDRDFG